MLYWEYTQGFACAILYKGDGRVGKLTASKQDYLEAILSLSQGENAGVRSVDVAALLGFSRASVSRAISLLKADGFLLQEPYGTITLTQKGLLAAQAVRDRHNLLKYYLIHLVEVDEDTAEQDACKMEHIVSEETLKRIEQIARDHMQTYHQTQHSFADGTESI